MENEKERSPSHRSGWALGLFSFGLIMTALYYLQLFLTSFYYASVEQDLKSKISQGASLHTLMADAHYRELFSASSALVGKTIELSTLVEEENYKKALHRISSKSFPAIRERKEITEKLDEIIVIKDRLKELHEQQEKLEEEEISEEEYTMRVADLEKNKNEIAHEESTLREKLHGLFREAFLSFVHSDLSPQERALYLQVKAVAEQFYYDLPPLSTRSAPNHSSDEVFPM